MKIRVENLSKTYSDAGKELTVLSNLSYDFPDSGSVAILGKSGVGKSTLMHLLGGLDKPSFGSVYFDDLDVFSLKDDQLSAFRGKNIGFVFQFHHLLPEFDAAENVAMPLFIAGEDENSALKKAEDMLSRVGLEKRLRHRPGELSGGEQQRVAIARAVIAEPEVILADEPTGNLDYETASRVQDLLHEINKDLNNLLVVVTHNRELAQGVHTRLEMGPGGELKEL